MEKGTLRPACWLAMLSDSKAYFVLTKFQFQEQQFWGKEKEFWGSTDILLILKFNMERYRKIIDLRMGACFRKAALSVCRTL